MRDTGSRRFDHDGEAVAASEIVPVVEELDAATCDGFYKEGIRREVVGRGNGLVGLREGEVGVEERGEDLCIV